MSNKMIIFLTGLRRVGKTTLMKQQIRQLLSQGVEAKCIFYISMDDYLLKDVSILDVIKVYRQLHKLPFDASVYCFLDEVTYQPDFRQQLKNLYDQGHCKVVVSSSSSSALRDKRGWLTGREQHIEVKPLSFQEYLLFRGIELKRRDDSLMEPYFEEYMQEGGMPEYVLNRGREYLTALLDDIIYKDIIGHYGIRHAQVIKDYFALLMERSGKQISINKVAKVLNISPDTAKRYLLMFEEAYLIYLVPRYGKTNEGILAPKKVYAADVGIRHLITGFRDKGAIFENIVFSLIKEKKPRYFYQEGTEIDFIIDGDVLIEVKYNDTLKEKQQALFDRTQAKKKLIICGYKDLHLLDDLLVK